MSKRLSLNDAKKRERIQGRFWEEVGAVEHISLPELESAIKRAFARSDNRFVGEQVEKMQTEGRIRIQSKVKVWIKKPKVDDQT